MPREFNTAGPCKADIHYMLPPTRRLPGVRALVEGQHYFVVHAPRQIGKTTALLGLGQELTAEGKFASVMLSCEAGVPFEDLERAVPAILGGWRGRAESFLPPDLCPPAWPAAALSEALGAAIRTWCRACPRPLVLFLDEVDGLAPDVLGSLLRQLRDGHANRPQGFPWSLALVGMRDLKDYVVSAGGTGRGGAGSPFNVSAGSLTMRNFTHDEIAELYAQHTIDTGQVFEAAAVDQAWALTFGQPWLVNALAREATGVIVRDRSQPVTVAHIDQAKETLVRRRDTHLQSLGSRLRDPRVRPIIEALMGGEALPRVSDDDLDYVRELGLVRLDEDQTLRIANPIYCDALPRALTAEVQFGLPADRLKWLDANGGLDLHRLLAGFLDFWRQHGRALIHTAPYHEIAPHLVLMAWLHKICNGGGTLQREFAIGTGRMDMCLTYGPVRLGIELKVWRDGREDPLIEGIEQLDRYLDGLGVRQGWLVIFDCRTRRKATRRKAGSEAVAGPVEPPITAEPRTSPSGFSVVVVRA